MPTQPRATLRDVARHAGVSIKTASRVVNADPAVAQATRDRVLGAIATVNYVPNAAARLLRAGMGDTIGLVIDSIADPWFSALTAVVEEHALVHGMTVVIGSSGRDPVRMRNHVQRLIQLRCSGLILAPLGVEKEYLRPMLHGLPMVCVDRPTDAGDYDFVHADDRVAAMRGAQHLIDHGHRRIAFMADDGALSTIGLRREGYTDALRANGIELDPGLIRPDSAEIDSAYGSTIALVRDMPDVTAIFTSTSRSGVGTTSALHAVGRTDIAVVSFGDFSLAAALDPPITVLDQDPRPVAAKASELLFERIGGATTPPVDLAVPARLIERGSGELRPHSLQPAVTAAASRAHS
jgi:LacI family transcriptional regulator